MPVNSTTTSQRFCCRHCGADVAIGTEPGGELAYMCQNSRCKWSGSIDCPEALNLKPEPSTPAPTLATAQERKAAFNLAQGVQIVPTRGGWLVPSSSRGAVVHLVTRAGTCSCEAGQNGRKCWHIAAVTMAESKQVAA
jgi:hypothetical protein